jgi:predicted short-subunit dehydrogenase-like oxidoreductase (DUF2520 family)
VVVVGSGNVAESIAVAVADSFALELKQVVARNAARAEAVAQVAGCDWTTDMEEAADADLYIIAVSDRAVGEVAEALQRRKDSIVVHTAGSVEMDALGDGDRGVLYPFQTFTAGRRVDFSAVPLFVEGADEATTVAIERVAKALSRRVYRASSAQRREVHLTGVLACNFVNALYAMAADRLGEHADLPFDVLRPLIEECARKAAQAEHPRRVQTGPAVRGDFSVAERHEAMLGSEREKEIYKLLTEYIWETSKRI